MVISEGQLRDYGGQQGRWNGGQDPDGKVEKTKEPARWEG